MYIRSKGTETLFSEGIEVDTCKKLFFYFCFITKKYLDFI